MKLIIGLLSMVTFNIFHSPTYEELINKVNTSEDLAWYLSEYEYQSDNNLLDEWRSPEETVSRKGGDCEDFAVLVYEVLTSAGYDCKVWIFWNKKEGHAICTYKKGNDIGYFTNNYRIKYALNTFDYMKYNGFAHCKPVSWRDKRFDILCNYYAGKIRR